MFTGLISDGQKLKIDVDSLNYILKGPPSNDYHWMNCNGILELFKTDTLVLYSASKSNFYFSECQSDSIAILDFGGDTTLISETTKIQGKVAMSFSTLDRYKIYFRKKGKDVYVTFRSYTHSYSYKLIELRQEIISTNKRFVLMMTKTKTFS